MSQRLSHSVFAHNGSAICVLIFTLQQKKSLVADCGCEPVSRSQSPAVQASALAAVLPSVVTLSHK